MSIAVIVPTRDRPRSLAGCLAALGAQDAPALELIVVDDGSRDRGAIEAVIAAAPGSPQLLRASGSGPAAARNLGAREASAPVICFTDDDCEPRADWARLLAEAATREGAAAGRTISPDGAAATVRASQAIVEHLTLSSLDSRSGRLGFAPTCNLAVTRTVAEGLPFDERFPAAAGEDRDWSARAGEAGAAPAYVPEAVVIHRQALDPRGFARQQYAYGRGAARFRASAEGRELAPLGFYARLMRRGFADGPGVGALVLGAQAATAAGVVAERFAHRGR